MGKRITSLNEVWLPVSQLEQNMNQFLQLVGRLFKQVDQQTCAESDMKLDEVELSVEISGEGEVKLVAGGKAAGKGAIKLKFKRSDAKTTQASEVFKTSEVYRLTSRLCLHVLIKLLRQLVHLKILMKLICHL